MKKPLLLLSQLLLAFFASAQFSPPADLVDKVGAARYAIAPDVDGDGDRDVICATVERLFWLPQTSPGSFGRQVLISEEDLSYYVLAADDADADGDQDFFFCTSDGVVALHRNNGDGTFSPKEILLDAPENCRSVFPADLDGDGDNDLLASLKTEVIWFANNGGGAFGAKQVISNQHNNLNAVHAEDLDGDGDLEVLAASTIDDKLAWYDNLGGGNFGVQQLVAPAFDNARMVATGDLDGDGRTDVLCNNMHSADGNLLWVRNLGNGTFDTAQVVGTAGHHFSAKALDLDGDGDLDVMTGYGLDQIGWFENDGTGQFAPIVELVNDVAYSYYFQTDDLNGDALPDLLYWTAYGVTATEIFAWRPALGGGNYGKEQLLALGVKEAANLVIADFDQDGFDDVAIGSGKDDAIVWMRYENGQFSPPKLVARVQNLDPNLLATADVNGDGLPDIFGKSTVQPTGHLYLGWYFNNGDGSFTAQPSVIGGYYMSDLQTGDVDNDGDLDMVWVDNGTNGDPNGSVNWIENLGNGVLAPGKVVAGGLASPVAGRVIKYASNQPTFIFVTKAGPDGVLRYRYLNDDFFDEFSTADNFQNGAWANVADVNRDGLPDFVATDQHYPSNYKIAYWLNNGNFTFGSQQTVGTGSLKWGVPAFGDLDLDGLPDWVVGSFDDEIHWFQGLGDGNFGSAQPLPGSTSGARQVQLKDLDKDGDLDLLALRLGWQANNLEDAYTISWNLANNQSMSGNVFFDENENGVLDAGEGFLGRFPVGVSPAALAVFTDENGAYKIYAGAGTYVISPDLGECWELTTQPAMHLVNFNGQDAVAGLDFGVKPVGTLKKAAVSLTSSPTRCGFTVPFWLNFRNDGCTKAGGRLALVQDSLATFQTADLALDAVSGDTLFWNFSDLLPGENRQIRLEYVVAGVDHLGDTIEMPAFIQGVDNGGAGQTLAEYDFSSVINCAVDPNDKQVYPRRSEQAPFDANFTLFDERLEYTIRFQNTGTDTAFNIVIRDTLSSDLDWSTFLPGSASHAYEATLHDAGLLEFHFRQIMLPDSNVNEPGSHGYVNFSILAKPGLADGTSVENGAGIFFDFNPPVLTNSVNSILVETLPSYAPVAAFGFSLTGNLVQFADLSTNDPASWFWDFGDGTTSTEQHPQHAYALPEDYEVCLSAANAWGIHQTCQELTVLVSTQNPAGERAGIFIHPNPADDVLHLDFKHFEENRSAAIFSATGVKMSERRLGSQRETMDVSGLPAGVYFLKIKVGGKSVVARKVVVF